MGTQCTFCRPLLDCAAISCISAAFWDLRFFRTSRLVSDSVIILKSHDHVMVSQAKCKTFALAMALFPFTEFKYRPLKHVCVDEFATYAAASGHYGTNKSTFSNINISHTDTITRPPKTPALQRKITLRTLSRRRLCIYTTVGKKLLGGTRHTQYRIQEFQPLPQSIFNNEKQLEPHR